jgi:hypothetical protein
MTVTHRSCSTVLTNSEAKTRASTYGTGSKVECDRDRCIFWRLRAHVLHMAPKRKGTSRRDFAEWSPILANERLAGVHQEHHAGRRPGGRRLTLSPINGPTRQEIGRAVSSGHRPGDSTLEQCKSKTRNRQTGQTRREGAAVTAHVLPFRYRRASIRICAAPDCRGHFRPRADHHAYCDDCHFWSKAIFGMTMARAALRQIERPRR